MFSSFLYNTLAGALKVYCVLVLPVLALHLYSNGAGFDVLVVAVVALVGRYLVALLEWPGYHIGRIAYLSYSNHKDRYMWRMGLSEIWYVLIGYTWGVFVFVLVLGTIADTDTVYMYALGITVLVVPTIVWPHEFALARWVRMKLPDAFAVIFYIAGAYADHKLRIPPEDILLYMACGIACAIVLQAILWKHEEWR